MRLLTMTRDAANAFVAEHHRHLGPVVGYKFALGCEHDGRIVGIAVVGRPLARAHDNGERCEVIRCCTLDDAPKGTPSWLYARCRRAAGALGYRIIQTYTLASEGGASLRGAGWTPTVLRARGGWDSALRARLPGALDHQEKIRWEAFA